MSITENPSEQLQVFLGTFKEYAAGNFEAFDDRFTEVCERIDQLLQCTIQLTILQDFRRDSLPSTLNFGPNEKLNDFTKEEYLQKLKFARAAVYKEDFKVR